jgi:chaperonin GroES
MIRLLIDSLREDQAMSGVLPLHDRVLVKRVEVAERTPGGVLIPDTAQEKPVEGDVLAVGPGTRDGVGVIHPLDVKVGDRVVFGKWAGTELLIEGEDRLILKEADILGVLPGNVSKAKAA